MRLLPLLALAGLGAYLLGRARTGDIDPDERIRRNVVALLSRHDGLQVTVNRGAVSLRGTVSRRERDDLLAAVLATPGVTEVSNLLEVEHERETPEQGAMPRGMGHPR
jgi:osmotically-inducible protein OsmY